MDNDMETGIFNDFETAAEENEVENINEDKRQTETKGETWADSLSADLKGFAENKGWKNSQDAVNSYKHLEKMFGADKAGKTLVIPKEDDSQAWGDIYKRLGRPDTADEYGLLENKDLEAMPIDNDFLGLMASTMHAEGLNKNQAQKLTSTYSKALLEMQMKGQENFENEWQSYKKELGANYETTIAVANSAAAKFDINKEEVNYLANVLGRARLVRWFAKAAAVLGEDKVPNGTSSDGNFKALSKEAASEKMDSLLANKDFSERYLNGDKSALKEIEKLSMLASS